MNNEKKVDHDEKKDNRVYNIIVNGRPKTVTSDELTYSDVIRLAFDNPPTGPNIMFTVIFRRGHGNKPDGTLVEGQSVKLKEGMIFDVTTTDKS